MEIDGKIQAVESKGFDGSCAAIEVVHVENPLFEQLGGQQLFIFYNNIAGDNRGPEFKWENYPAETRTIFKDNLISLVKKDFSDWAILVAALPPTGGALFGLTPINRSENNLCKVATLKVPEMAVVPETMPITIFCPMDEASTRIVYETFRMLPRGTERPLEALANAIKLVKPEQITARNIDTNRLYRGLIRSVGPSTS